MQASDGKGGKPLFNKEDVKRSELRVAKNMERASRKAAIVYKVPVP